MHVYAHRGWHGPGRPENSLAAFRHAAGAGVGIETDLRTTTDGAIVLFHDRTAGDAAVADLNRAALDEAAGRPVPLLDDLLAADLGVPLNLEVKTRAAWAALRPYLPQLPAGVLVSSFVHPIAVAAAEAGLEAAYLLASLPLDLPPTRLRLATAVWDFNMVDAALPARARAAGLATIVYGPRTVAEHRALAAWGCDGVITDTPDHLL